MEVEIDLSLELPQDNMIRITGLLCDGFALYKNRAHTYLLSLLSISYSSCTAMPICHISLAVAFLYCIVEPLIFTYHSVCLLVVLHVRGINQ